MSIRLRVVSAVVVTAAAFSVFGFAYPGRGALARGDQETSHAQTAARGQIDLKRLLSADKHPGDWLTTGRDIGKGHYSPLKQINKDTVGRLPRGAGERREWTRSEK